MVMIYAIIRTLIQITSTMATLFQQSCASCIVPMRSLRNQLICVCLRNLMCSVSTKRIGWTIMHFSWQVRTHTAVHAGWSGKMICVTLMRRLKLHGVSVWLIPSNTTSTFSSSSSVSGTQFAIMHM